MQLSRFFRYFRHLNGLTLRRTIVRAMRRRLMGLSAEMAYHAMLALFPTILVIFTAIGLFEESLQTPLHSVAERLSQVVPAQAMQLIRNFADEINRGKNGSLFSLSFILAIWVSSGAISAAMNALDQIHKIPHNKRRPFWKAKLISLALTIGNVLFLVVASFLVFISDLVVRFSVKQLGIVVDQSGVDLWDVSTHLLNLWDLLRWPLALSLVSLDFAAIYRFGPSRRRRGTPIAQGALLAAIFWAIVSRLFRLYVENFGNYNKVYGAVGAVIVLMLWLYVTSLIVLLGEQLNVTVGETMERKRINGLPKPSDRVPHSEVR